MWGTGAVVSMDAALIAIRILRQVFILKPLNPVLADLTVVLQKLFEDK
jgi:hypothetical protein